MLENMRLSIKGIWSHKMRSFLTMLGIIIGIAAIIAIVSTIKGTNEQIKENLIGNGTNTVEIVLQQDGYDADFSYESIPEGVPQFGESQRSQLQEIDHASSVTFYHSRTDSSACYYKNTSFTGCKLYGVDDSYFKTTDARLVKGRFFTDADLTGFRKVIILDETAAEQAFTNTDPIGEVLDIRGEPFVVIGIVNSESSSSEPVINSVDDYYNYMSDTGGSLYVPDQMWPTLYGYDEPCNITIKADGTDYMSEVGKQAQNLVNTWINPVSDSVKYKAVDLASQASELQSLSSSSNSMLIGIAAISLLVGGIGVMNIMLVSVTERTREIGLKKALGAKKRQILAQFLTEAATLSLIGGAIGIVLGLILARVISFLTEAPTAISWVAIVVSAGFSILIGIIFGLLPSVKAAKLNPIDALRYE